MNNHPSEHNVQQSQRRVDSRPIAPRLPLLTTSCMAVAVAMALAWQTAFALPDGALPGGTIATGAISRASGANAAGTAGTPAAATTTKRAETTYSCITRRPIRKDSARSSKGSA